MLTQPAFCVCNNEARPCAALGVEFVLNLSGGPAACCYVKHTSATKPLKHNLHSAQQWGVDARCVDSRERCCHWAPRIPKTSLLSTTQRGAQLGGSSVQTRPASAPRTTDTTASATRRLRDLCLISRPTSHPTVHAHGESSPEQQSSSANQNIEQNIEKVTHLFSLHHFARLQYTTRLLFEPVPG